MHWNHKINEKRLRRIHQIWANVARIYAKATVQIERVVKSGPSQAARKAVIFKGEMDFISRCILDRKNIETGGQLFGYWTEDGTPVILYAIGPGPRANHQVTFFNQDIDYLVKVGNILRNRYGAAPHRRVALASSARAGETKRTRLGQYDKRDQATGPWRVSSLHREL